MRVSIVILCITLIIAILIYIFYLKRIRKPKNSLDNEKKDQNIIDNHTLNQKNVIHDDVKEKQHQYNIRISSETETEILRRLDLFEKHNAFLKKDITLNSLAKELHTNTKYLSEIIRVNRQKQFNNYLNELRIHYIVNRLKTDPNYLNTKIIYLASDSGFSSHSSFTTIFTQIMNESPSAFVKRLKKDQKQ